jgi:hypothetical protein
MIIKRLYIEERIKKKKKKKKKMIVMNYISCYIISNRFEMIEKSHSQLNL